jgi:hypothetical protein
MLWSSHARILVVFVRFLVETKKILDASQTTVKTTDQILDESRTKFIKIYPPQIEANIYRNAECTTQSPLSRISRPQGVTKNVEGSFYFKNI